MRIGARLPAVMLAAALAACGGDGAPKSPSTPSQPGPVSLKGGESVEWDQEIAAGIDLSRYRFAAYVDSSRVELPAAACRADTPGMAICRSPFPPMSPGTHTLTFVSYITFENVDSAQSSPPLTVLVGASVTASAAQESDAATSPKSQKDAIDCALAPAGEDAVITAVPSGELRLWDISKSVSSALVWDIPGDREWQLRAVATSPAFLRNRFVYVLLRDASAEDGDIAVVRYRELEGVLGERAVLAILRNLPYTARPRLRFGPDAKLYIALLTDWRTGTSRLSEAPPPRSEPFLLRLNDDGTIPPDRPRLTPFLDVLALSPSAFDWDPVTRQLWIVDRSDGEHAVARQVGSSGSEVKLAAQPPAGPIALLVLGGHTGGERLLIVTSGGDGYELEIRDRPSQVTGDFAIDNLQSLHDAIVTSNGSTVVCGSLLSATSRSVSYVVRLTRLRSGGAGAPVSKTRVAH